MIRADDAFGGGPNEHSISTGRAVGASALDGDGFGEIGAGAEFFYSSGDDDDDEEGDFHVAGVEQDLEGGNVDEESVEDIQGDVIAAERMSNVDAAELIRQHEEDEDELEDEGDAATRRIRLMEHLLRFNDFNSLPLRYKLAGMIEPPILGDTQIHPNYLNAGRAYAVIISTFALLHVVAICVFSVESAEDYGLYAVYATTAVSAIDVIMRLITLAPRSSKLGVAIDILILVASILFIMDVYRRWAVLGAILRGLRFMRVTILFEEFETMRDIYLVHRTIVASIQSLIVFLVVFMIGLFIFATGVWVLEQDHFNVQRGIWMRPCTEFEGCTTEPSPFQSIPDAMWLIGSTMTTVGLGDVVPSTTSARIITGIAILAGVFVVAFPTMILVGNLTAVRRAYFRDQERRTARLQLLAVQALATEQEEAGFDGTSKRVSAFQHAVLAAFKATHGANTENGKSQQDINAVTGILNRSSSKKSARSFRRPPQNADESSPLTQAGVNPLKKPFNTLDSSMFGNNVPSAVFANSTRGGDDGPEPLDGDEGMYCGLLLKNEVTRLPKRVEFDFMGGKDGQPNYAILGPTGQYNYAPINRILPDCRRNNFGVLDDGNDHANVTNEREDGAPQISNYTLIDDSIALITLHLVVDDEVARISASDAILQACPHLSYRPIVRALPIHSLEIAFASEAPEGLTLLRRSDIGEIVDDHIPIVIAVKDPHQFGIEPQHQIQRLQQLLRGTQLRITYRIHPKASAFWRRTHHIDKDLIEQTLFVRELWGIAANISADFFMTPSQKASASQDILNAKRNIAYISKKYVPLLLDELLERLSEPMYAGTLDAEGRELAVITNRSHIEQEVTEMIAFHCREVFYEELPPMLKVAVFGRHLVEPQDSLLEVDVDFFKHSEWPIGAVMVEYSPTEALIDRTISIWEANSPPKLKTPTNSTANPLMASSPLKSGLLKRGVTRSLGSERSLPLVRARTASHIGTRVLLFTSERNLENSLRGADRVEEDQEDATRLRRNKTITDEIAGLVGTKAHNNDLHIPSELLDDPNGGFDIPLDTNDEEELGDMSFNSAAIGQSPGTNSLQLSPSKTVENGLGVKEATRSTRPILRDEDFDDDYYNDVLTRGKKNLKLNAVASRKRVQINLDYTSPIVKADPSKEKWGKLRAINKLTNLKAGGRFKGLGKLPPTDQ